MSNFLSQDKLIEKDIQINRNKSVLNAIDRVIYDPNKYECLEITSVSLRYNYNCFPTPYIIVTTDNIFILIVKNGHIDKVVQLYGTDESNLDKILDSTRFIVFKK